MMRIAAAEPAGAAPKPPLWTPSRERLDASKLASFTAWLAEHGQGPADPAAPVLSRPGDPRYAPLWRWSITEQEAFWAALWDWCVVVGERGGRVLVDGDRMPGARYFPDARLNFAENLLRRRTDDPAIIAWSEDGARRVVSWRELYDLTSRVAQAMRNAGIGPGDRVAVAAPQRTRGHRGPPRGRLDRRGSLHRVTRLRRPRRDRPLRPGRAPPPLRHGRLQVPRQALRDAGAGAGDRRGAAVGGADRGGSEPGRRTDRHPRPPPPRRLHRPLPDPPKSPSPASPSTTPSTSSSHPAPPACRSASSTARAASSFSTSRSTSSTATSGPATASSTTRPWAG